VVTPWPPNAYGPPAQQRSPSNRGRWAKAWSALTLLMATAALVVGIIGLNRPTARISTTSKPPPVVSPTTPAPIDTTAKDRALCESVAPLIRENAERGREFVNLGQTGTPERDGGIPSYARDVSHWVKTIQPILDQYADADAFLRRTLQRFIDDTRIYAESIRPGPENDADAAAWNDKLVAIGGPFEVCRRLGVEW
jgi:hypothetical protein